MRRAKKGELAGKVLAAAQAADRQAEAKVNADAGMPEALKAAQTAAAAAVELLASAGRPRARPRKTTTSQSRPSPWPRQSWRP